MFIGWACYFGTTIRIISCVDPLERFGAAFTHRAEDNVDYGHDRSDQKKCIGIYSMNKCNSLVFPRES